MSKKPTTRANNKSRRAAADAPPAPDANPKRLITGGSEYRKAFPMTTGFLDYFPDAVAEGSRVSFIGNMKHNPGEAMHHARGKSMDHADCILRHLAERGGFDTVIVDGVEYRIRHSAALFWRAAALLQAELEEELGLPLPRGAKK